MKWLFGDDNVGEPRHKAANAPSITVVGVMVCVVNVCVAQVDDSLREVREIEYATMRKGGASEAEIVSQKENYYLLDHSIQINTWAQWTNYYHAVILDPPVTFDLRDLVAMDFDTPVSACRSYLRACFVQDEATLLKFADASGKEYLKNGSLIGGANAARKGSLQILTRVNLLLTAETTFRQRDYVLVLWRAQNAHNPTNGLIGLQTTFFVRDPEWNRFLLTRELAQGRFGDVLHLTGASGAALGEYDHFHKLMSKSPFPPHFYRVP